MLAHFIIPLYSPANMATDHCGSRKGSKLHPDATVVAAMDTRWKNGMSAGRVALILLEDVLVSLAIVYSGSTRLPHVNIASGSRFASHAALDGKRDTVDERYIAVRVAGTREDRVRVRVNIHSSTYFIIIIRHTDLGASLAEGATTRTGPLLADLKIRSQHCLSTIVSRVEKHVCRRHLDRSSRLKSRFAGIIVPRTRNLVPARVVGGEGDAFRGLGGFGLFVGGDDVTGTQGGGTVSRAILTRLAIAAGALTAARRSRYFW